MRLAIIPARGGSKRIPRKNIKIFCGLPMIAWPIREAFKSKCFDRIIVSTDDEEIAEVAKLYGAEVPYIRPSELAGDYTGTTEVMSHAVRWHLDQGEMVEDVCCIYATAPFLQSKDLVSGLEALKKSNASYALSITAYAFPIQRSFRITSDQRLQMFNPEQFGMRSQDLEPAWHDAAQFYWGRPLAWIAKTPIFGKDSVPVPIPNYRVHDIDSEDDWLRAELMMKTLKKQLKGKNDV